MLTQIIQLISLTHNFLYHTYTYITLNLSTLTSVSVKNEKSYYFSTTVKRPLLVMIAIDDML